MKKITIKRKDYDKWIKLPDDVQKNVILIGNNGIGDVRYTNMAIGNIPNNSDDWIAIPRNGIYCAENQDHYVKAISGNLGGIQEIFYNKEG